MAQWTRPCAGWAELSGKIHMLAGGICELLGTWGWRKGGRGGCLSLGPVGEVGLENKMAESICLVWFGFGVRQGLT